MFIFTEKSKYIDGSIGHDYETNTQDIQVKFFVSIDSLPTIATIFSSTSFSVGPFMTLNVEMHIVWLGTSLPLPK
jgi:hypothetical protein